MQAALAAMSVRTVGDLRAWPLARLRQRFGDACAEHLFRQARGEASDEVGGDWERKQISKETTFEEDESDPDVIRDTLLELSAGVGRVARREDKRGLTVTLKIRFPDFETHTRQRTLDHAVSTDRKIFAAARELYAEANRARRPVRLIGVGISDWEPASGRQLDLCFVDEEKETRLFAAVDRIAERFGRDAIGLGAVGARKTKKSGNDPRGASS
jgi:DNA polymerase-4